MTIPSSVTRIREYTFYGCTSLTSVTIPSSVTRIGGAAFYGCNNLLTVISLIQEPFAINNNTFTQNTFTNADLIIPIGTMDKYKSTEGWKKFMRIQEDAPSGISTTASEVATEEGRYTIDGKRISSPQRGINIIRMSDGTTRKVFMK